MNATLYNFLWPKLQTLVRIQSERQRAGKMVHEERFYISTLPMRQVETIASSVRSQWGIENQLHWVLITLNLLRQDPNTKRSIKHRRFKAALLQEYRWAALIGFPSENTTT